jgi:hypothetical protein
VANASEKPTRSRCLENQRRANAIKKETCAPIDGGYAKEEMVYIA